MPELVEIKLRDGSTILAEVEEGPRDAASSHARSPVSLGGELIERADFGETMRSVQAAAAEVAESLHSMARMPNSCEVSFGIKLSASGSAILAKMSGDVNFSVTLKWTAKSTD